MARVISATYRNMSSWENKLGDMAGAERLPNGLFDPVDQAIRETFSFSEFEKQEHALVVISLSSLPHAKGLFNFNRKLSLDDSVYLGRAESNTGWVEDSI